MYMLNKYQEILNSDETHNSLDNEIITYEKTFKRMLNKNQLEAYLKLESMVCRQINYDEQLICNALSK